MVAVDSTGLDSRTPKQESTDSSTGRVRAMRFARMTRSHSGSNFFQPAAYAAWRTRPVSVGLVAAARRIDPQR